MAGFYGYPVDRPMEVPQEGPPRYLSKEFGETVDPEALPIPGMEDLGLTLLRQKDARALAKPQMALAESMDRGRAIEAAELARDIGISYDITRAQASHGRRVAKAKGQRSDKINKNYGSGGDRGKSMSRRNMAKERAAVWRVQRYLR